MVHGEFVPASEERYAISPDESVMAVAREKRSFDDQEAASLHHLLDVLRVYCAESGVAASPAESRPQRGPRARIGCPTFSRSA